jgi:hypothetical protein
MPRLPEITRFRLGNLQRAPEEETQTTEGDRRKKQLHAFLDAAKQSKVKWNVITKAKRLAIESVKAPGRRIFRTKKRRSATEENCAIGRLS